MKTQIKRFSKSALAVVLTLCMLVSCMTVGIIATDAAKTADESVGAISNISLAGSFNSWSTTANTSTSFPASWDLSLTANTTYQFKVVFKENGSDNYCGITTNNDGTYNVSDLGTAKRLYWRQGGNINFKPTTTGTYTFKVTTSGGNNYITITQKAATPLTAPTLKYNNATTTPVNITGSSANLTWASVSNASSYTVYKDGNAVKTSATSPYTATETGSYTVKAIGNGTTYSDSDASNAIQLNFQKTTTIYIKSGLKNKNGGGPLTNAYIWSNSDAKWNGDWPGSAISGWTASGDYYYKEFTNSDSSFKVILQGNNAQTSDSASYDTGKIYRIDSVNTTGDNGQAVLTEGAPETLYDITVTSGTGGKIKVGTATASTSQTAKAGNTTTASVTAVPNNGYHFTSWTKSDAVTYASGNATTETVTINASSTGTLKAAFAKTNYTVTLDKNADDATAGTASVTANYGYVMPTATMPTRAGYTFAGYYDTSAATGGTQYYTAGGASARKWNKTADTTLYARWTEVKGGAVAKAYTSGSASDAGGTVKVGSGTAAASVDLSSIGITSSNTVTATKNTNYSFTGWQFSGTKAANLRYRFGTSGDWLTPAAGTTYGTASNTTIYIKTDGTSGITNTNAEVRALFEPTTYTGLKVSGKYSANGSTYTTAMPTAPTIAATSGTNQTGVKVTAPDVDGYQFVTWYTTQGGFDNNLDKETMFKPNANSAEAVARYKKIYTLASSVDSTGTGAGTVSISITSGSVDNATDKILAGGSYTITSNAKNGSSIESVTVNNTSKGTNATTEVSGVSANQTVSVKFASKPHVIGKVAAAGWTEPGDAMKSNAAGTEFTFTRTELAAGTYDFQHYIGTGKGGTYDSTSTDIATKTISGGATLSSVDNGYGGKKFQLVLTAKSDVTLVSNGSKFTAITVRRSGGQKYNVTFKKVANTTITGTYLGTPFTTASADAVVEVYSGDDINFTVTPDSDKYISGLTTSAGTLNPAFAVASHGNKYEGKTNVTSARTITPTVGSKLTVSAKTNKSDRGTVTVDNNTAYPGQKVKVTVSPKNGVLKTLTYTYGTTTISLYPTTNSSLNATKLDVATVTAMMYDFFNKSGEALGAAVNDEAVGADSTYTFTMPSEPVTVNATFDSYSAEANYYYSGYDTGGNIVNGYDTKRLTESIFGGEKFAYYHVEGRTDVNQLFTIFTKADQQGYVYFTQPSAYGYWSKDQAPKAYFWNDNGTVGTAWPGTSMTSYDTDNGQNRYRIRIPDGATHVKFSDGSSSTTNQTTHDITLQTGVGGYYLGNNAWNNDAYTATSYTVNNSDPQGLQNGTVYYNYEDDAVFKTGELGFTKTWENWNVHNNSYARPNEDMSNKDYYIIVLYPGKTYKVGDKTYTVGSTYPAIFWSAESPVEEESVKVFAKDGSIRSDSNGATYANIADTKIYAANGTTTVGTKVSGTITNQTYETYKVDKGETIVIKTTIGATDSSNLSNADALKAKYYVRGFCVNGEVSELLEPNDTGVYTLTYKVPEDYEGKNIEITPIYYLKNTTANPIVTYRVTGFTDALKAVGSGKPGWGDTLYTYPFYGKLGGQNNAFGAYPGQPMVYYKGQYQMQIPQKSTAWDPNGVAAATVNNTTVSGVTMSNGYWDSVHKTIMGYGDNSKSADHVQTYDYGDFYKIFNEKAPVDNIVFDFKYRTTTHNLVTDAPSSPTPSNLTSTYNNGFELLTNFHGRNVDLFGDPLSGDAADPSKTKPLYVVSIGGVKDNVSGVENIAGYYATEWKVFAPNLTTGTPASSDTYKLVSTSNKNSIPPEVLVLNNNSTSFNNTTYPSADAGHQLTNWQELYTALETYRGRPVMISYEAADAQQGQGMYYTGTGGATRNDGRWLYSKNGENITSKIKIQYSNDNGKNYNDLNTTNPQVEGLSAYFTNDGVEGQMTYSTTIDPDKTFDFEAKTTNADYKFVGWFMEDGTKITTDNSSHTERSGSYTFVAKFMQVTTGQLMLSHIVEPNNIGETIYDGTGTATIAAVVKNDEGEIVRTFDATTSDIILDDKIIKSDNSAYTIDVTLTSTRGTNSGFAGVSTMLKTPSDQSNKFFNYGSYDTSADGYTHTFNLSFTVGDLFSDITQQYKHIVYQSYFQKYVFNYTVNYEFTGRDGQQKIYNRAGTLTAAQAEKYVYKTTTGNVEQRWIKKEFFEKLAPYESNFQQNLSWNISDTWFTGGTNYVYNCNTHYSASSSNADNKVNVTFVLPYVHDNGVATLNNGVGTAAESTNYALINDGTNDNRVAFATIPKLTGGRTNGIYSADDGEKQYWIAAPAKLNNGDFFSHWSIKTTDSNVEVAKCYFPGFNFLAYENYIIEAVYGSVESDVSTSGIYTNATYLSTTRNQWNALNSSTAAVPNVDKTDRVTAADVLYNDFVLNYHYNDVDIYKDGSDASDIKELGVVVERVKELDKNSDESYDTRISSYTSLSQNIDDVKTAANSSADNGKAQDINGSQYYKQRIAKKDLDNKNRIQFFEAFYNAAGWDSANQKPVASYKAKRYVYRAYTYIKYNDNGVEKIAISDTPAYFVMYDVATANYSSN